MSRVRSPNYPAMSLPDAIERIRSVHEKQQTTTESKDVVVNHMGYGSINGSALKSLSALIKYGLLSDVGDAHYAVSNRAVEILYPENEDSKNAALLEAAYSPKLFSDMFERWDGERPSEVSLESYLVRQGFNIKAVRTVARVFYDTLELVKITGDSYAADDTQHDVKNGDEQTIQSPAPEEEVKIVVPAPKSDLPQPIKGIEMNCTKPVFDFESVSISTKIDNREDLEELMARLEQIKSLLPAKTEH